MSLPLIAEAPAVGIVIPTFNRWPILRQCLQHLERQTETGFEVIVVDDGSSDETQSKMLEYEASARLRLRYLRQANQGCATARNHAIALLNAPVCILIGDDILTQPDFVQQHRNFHETHREVEAVALGYTRWSETAQQVTPLMRWLERDGVQFAYGELLAGKPATWKHFYTSNLSVKTSYLRKHPFHTGFQAYGMEDIELGYRLACDYGLQMHFLPQAVGDHVHPTDFIKTCHRLLSAGAGSFQFESLWLDQRRSGPSSPAKSVLLRILTEPRVMLPALRLAGALSIRFRFPNAFMRRVLSLHELAGYNCAASRASEEAGGAASL